jgi:tetratricopeptide (TPR) repeat protein/tRNA A-37 threonylcarbamoyl transferase component Bud32
MSAKTAHTLDGERTEVEGLSGRREDEKPLERGATVGRYVVIEPVGRGAMGVVYAAYDPNLDRKVALKILASGARRKESARARLLREAQALARVSHPSVVTVHDVGWFDEKLFIAMEFVSGVTLRQWCEEHRGDWRAVLRVMLEAGEGLASAHDKDLVHRDFKPDNVMVGDDGRVRVLDFGLARALRDPVDEHSDITDGGSMDSKVLNSELTQVGAMIGTPAYMSPEQHTGLVATEKSDQFSFCVALYEALYDQRPFAATGRPQLALAVTEGRVQPPPKNSEVPSWLRRVVIRGLEVDAGLRWPNMGALLAALRADPSAKRKRVLMAVTLLAGVAGVGTFASQLGKDAERACESGADKMARFWNVPRASSIRQTMEDSGLNYAGDLFERVEPLLDDYASAWAGAHKDACLASRRGEQSSQLLDRRMLCLEERRAAFDAVLQIFEGDNSASVEGAMDRVVALPALSTCSDPRALDASTQLPLDVADAERVEALARELAALEVRVDPELAVAAVAPARDALERAREVDWPPIQSRAALLVSRLLAAEGKFSAGVEPGTDAYFDALAGGDDEAATRAAIWMTHLVGASLARHEEGRAWSRHAVAHVAHTQSDELEGDQLAALGGLLRSAGDYQEARDALAASLAQREATWGPEDLRVADSLLELAAVERDLDQHRAALQLDERAQAIRVSLLGPEHPDVAEAVNEAGLTLQRLGRDSEALERHGEALRIYEATLGPRHPRVAAVHNNLGIVLKSRGELRSAAQSYEVALEINTATFGDEHPSVLSGLNNLGNVHYDLFEYETAIAYHRRTLELKLKVLGPDHPRVGMSHNNLGNALQGAARYSEALEEHEAAVEQWTQTLEPNHGHLAFALTGVGIDQLGLGHPRRAIGPLERAISIRAGTSGATTDTARTRFALGRALWLSGGDRDEARRLVAQARATFASLGRPARRYLEELDAWVELHPDAGHEAAPGGK